jgi:NAD(P)H dehydrogenase (quinone)
MTTADAPAADDDAVDRVEADPTALVLVAHPVPDSLTHAAATAAVEGLRAAGHRVRLLDLYAIDFPAAMSTEERRAYSSTSPIVDDLVAEHCALLGRARHLVFVYPTWWSGPPAILKGWLERVLVTGVAFELDPDTKRVKPALGHIERIVGISTYGSPRPYVAMINDNGRRILTRSLRMVCGWRTSTRWVALYGVDTATADERAAFLTRIRSAMTPLRRRATGTRGARGSRT